MSIKLEVEKYCENCEDFEPVAYKASYQCWEKITTDTVVKCQNADKCRCICAHIKGCENNG